MINHASFNPRHLLSAKELTYDKLEELFTLACQLEKQLNNGKTQDFLRGKILATLFFEASTRTRFSFESAMLRLGGQVISLESGDNSSLQKGESLEDTGRIVSSYADIIVVRHPQEGSAAQLARYAEVPVINAGDGSNQHPTQALLDLYTMLKEKGQLDGKVIGLYGDLRYGRAVHSLITLLSHFKVTVVLIAPPGLELPSDHLADFSRSAVSLSHCSDLVSVLPELDVLYCTRIQRERFLSTEEYAAVKNSYQLNKKMLDYAKADCSILHPLPRLDEIATDVDNCPQARYFAQAKNGVAIRMALLKLLLTAQ